jgi:hypothetical protein
MATQLLPLVDPVRYGTETCTLPADLIADILSFAAFGTPTEEVTEDGIRYLINEFWTSGQRQAHAIHEVSYRACFKPQLPEFFIARLSEPGDAIHDPFMGRGTTPVQAALMARRPVGNDINPLSVILTRPRLTPPSLPEIAAQLRTIPWQRGAVEREDLLVFFHEETLKQICALRAYLQERAPLDGPCDPVDDWIRMVAINRLTGHSPGFFSVYTLPPNQAVSVESQRKINEKRNQSPQPKDIAALILRKSRSLLAEGGMPTHPPAILGSAPAHDTPFIADGSVTLTVTSPPFLDIVQYAEDNWLRCWFAGIDVDQVKIDRHRDTAAWTAMVRATLAELARVTKAGGHVAFEVGEVRNGQVLLEKLVWQAAEGLPFERLAVLVNRQAFTKTSNCWGIRNNARGTNTNRIVVLRRQ